MKPTIYSIAASVGVSASTVSRAFNRPAMVREELREEILAVARDQGYQTNRAARELVTGTSAFIGVAIVDITNPFIPPLIREIEGVFVARGTAAAAVPAPLALLQKEGAVG